ncbi:chaperone NapD [Histophilus somni]|uniref:chaperone NapD n=1 Tax=Histophilus somni TaxID=731 RepID=UPI00109D1B92|nr:chaperone NapD [Histophilus somni]QEH17257.1 chaperone NapD [Histophilus somni]THA21803.1 chaperone NapD [Histophilus somni]
MKENKNAKNHAEEWHVCSLIIQVNPQKIAQVKTALLTIPHTEIPAEDEKGKLVVVMQSDDPQVLLNHMENSRNIDGVIDLSLIYHQQDDNVEQ